jgi:hypothetical protein
MPFGPFVVADAPAARHHGGRGGGMTGRLALVVEE